MATVHATTCTSQYIHCPHHTQHLCTDTEREACLVIKLKYTLPVILIEYNINQWSFKVISRLPGYGYLAWSMLASTRLCNYYLTTEMACRAMLIPARVYSNRHAWRISGLQDNSLDNVWYSDESMNHFSMECGEGGYPANTFQRSPASSYYS